MNQDVVVQSAVNKIFAKSINSRREDWCLYCVIYVKRRLNPANAALQVCEGENQKFKTNPLRKPHFRYLGQNLHIYYQLDIKFEI